MVAGLLRGSEEDLRAKRAKLGEGSQERRVGTSAQRRAHATRGSFIDYQKDLGIATDYGTASRLRAGEKEFATGVKKQEGIIGSAEGQYRSAQGELDRANRELKSASAKLPNYRDALNKSWSSYRRNSLVPLRVVDASGHRVEATYYVTRDTAKNAAGNRSLISSWHGPYLNVSTNVRGPRGVVGEGQMIHDSFRGAGQQTESAYKSKAGKQINRELAKADKKLDVFRSKIASKQREVSAFGRDVSSARGLLSGQKKRHKGQWSAIHERYAKRTETMKKIFGGLKVG